jgi:hypothetical protein
VEISNIIAVIDLEIAKLQEARALLAGSPAPKAGRGRPKGSKNATSASAKSAASVAKVNKVLKGKRELSPEGRKAIADAMKRRWAERRKQVAKSA